MDGETESRRIASYLNGISPRTPIVFRLQEPPPRIESSRNYESLGGYGEMVTILPVDLNPSVKPELACQALSILLEYAKDSDYILWAGGDPMTAFLAGQILSQLGVYPRWLRWDRRTDGQGNRTRHGYYVPVEYSMYRGKPNGSS